MAFAFLKSLDADDIFISYSRTDASAYVAGLDAALSAKEFSCFTDKRGTDAGALPPETLFQKIKLCKTLVLLVTPGALARPENIAQELSEFAKAQGTARIVCVSFVEESTYASGIATQFAIVVGKVREREDPNALETGKPSDSVVATIVAACTYMKSKDRLRKYRDRVFVGLLGLLASSVIAAVFASYEFRQVGQATVEAQKQGGLAESRSLANSAQSLLRERPEELLRALSLSVDAMEKSIATGVRTVEADSALRDSLALLPRLRRSDKYAGHGDFVTEVALSPDGRYFAMLAPGNVLRIYDSASEVPFEERKPIKQLPCECSAIALSREASYAVGVTEAGVKVFDLKDDSRSHLVPLPEGVSVSKVALSPGGRYLALSVDEGEDVGRLSKLQIVESKSGKPIKVFDELNLLIQDIEFGPAGNLAVGGTEGGSLGFGRVVLWSLPSSSSNGGVEPDLAEASFRDSQVVRQRGQINAVAPGADSTYFATDRGVWKKRPGATDYSIVAFLPYARNFPSNSSISRLAFAPDGQTLVLARGIDARDQNDNEEDQSVLEVWGMLPGHQDLAHVWESKEITSVAFKPGEPVVATMTGPPTMEAPARVFGAVDGAPLGDIAFEAESGQRTVKYVSPDGRYLIDADDGVAGVWDVWGKRKVQVPFTDVLERLDAVTVSAGGKFLAIAGSTGNGDLFLVIYRAEGGSYHEWKEIPQPKDQIESVVSMSISADGKHLAVLYSYAEQFVWIWDVPEGKNISPADLNEGGDVDSIALSSDGRFLVLTAENRTQLLDLSQGKRVTAASLLEDAPISCVVFSSDNRYLGLGGDDGIVHIFETKSPEGVIARLGHTGRITAIAFSDDGRYVATSSSNPHPYHLDEEESYPTRVWLLQPAELIAEARARLAPFK